MVKDEEFDYGYSVLLDLTISECIFRTHMHMAFYTIIINPCLMSRFLPNKAPRKKCI